MLSRFSKLPINVSRHMATLANGMKLVDLKNNQTSIQLTYKDTESEEKTLSFNPHWLRFNCHSTNSKIASTNQRQIIAEEVPLDLKVESMEVVDENLIIDWNDKSGQKYSVLPLQYMLNNCPSNVEEKAKFKPCTELVKFDYQKMFPEGQRSNDEVYKWLNHMAEYGLAIVENFGTEANFRVKEFCSSTIAPVSRTIYGDAYDVRVEKKPINIAYAEGALPFHMDLIYYEAPPGLQFLHCCAFDDCIEGGESLVLDAFHVAEEFRLEYPEYFQVLAKTPVTFQKMHVLDGKAEVMMHSRPHIKLNNQGEIMSMSWSPANEGPLKNLSNKQVKDYYEAYLHFSKAINSSPHIHEFRLLPGQIMCFNNRRMLHGRNSFNSNNGTRHFQGCYVNIDEFRSELRSQRIIRSSKQDSDKSYVDLKNVKIEKLQIGNNDFE